MICRGFKSFRNKTIIQFDKGFTAIVGANGSGKSNIIDAFCFVLGELSAKTLRANNTKDLISNGGNGQPAAKSAFVEIIFDNSDHRIPGNLDYVSVSREVDESGQSDYRLNGKRSSRKEIMELLDLANMLPNSTNLIMQGELFRLINMNSTQRRELLEQLSGISAFEEKKQQAMKELESVQTNLGNIALLLSEIYTQMQDLEEEKKDAERYLALIDEQKKRTRALYEKKISGAQLLIDSLMEEIRTYNKQMKEIELVSSTLKEKEKGLVEALEGIKTDISKIENSELRVLSIDLQKKKDLLAETASFIKYSTQNISTIEKDIVNLTNEKSRMESTIESNKNSSNENRVKFESIKANLENLENERHQLIKIIEETDKKFAEVRKNLETIKKRYDSQRELCKTLESEMKINQNKMESSQAQKKSIERRVKENEATIQSLRGQLAQYEIELKQLNQQCSNEQIDGENKNEQTAEEKIKEMQKEIGFIQAKIKQTQRILNEKQKSLTELRSIMSVQSQMNSGNRAVEEILKMKTKGEFKNVYGTIAQLGTCPKEYEIAMNEAGGNRFSFLVVEDKDTASACIEFLKSKNIGRASFIPLRDILYSKNDYSLPNDPQIIGRAVDLIKFDEYYEPAFEFVFGKTLIVEDLETAKRLKVPFRKITLDGDVVESSNLMTGGKSQKNTNSGFKSISDNEIIELESSIAELERDIENNERKIAELTTEINRIYNRKISNSGKINEISQKIAVIKSKIDQNLLSNQSFSEEIVNINTQIDLIFKTINDLALDLQSKKEIENQILKEKTEIESQLVQNSQNEDAMKLKEIEQKIKQNEKELRKLENEIVKNDAIIDQISSRLKSIESDLINKNKRIEELKQEIVQKDGLKQQLNSQIKELDAILSEKSEKLSELLKQKKDLLNGISAVRLEISQNENNYHPIKIKINTAQMKIEEMQGKLGDYRCKINPEIPIIEEYMKDTETRIEQRISEIGDEIRKLGAVNLKSIEKYDEIKARFVELDKKNESIIKEKEKILQFISELESQKYRVFMDCFENINENFKSIFSKLSPDGEAKLELENKENPFIGGLDIMARPGQKKWCLTQAMSGGEKTLTIIALVLAIQMYKPSPYYILDEIDAALDDANASLVAELIKQLSEKSQFIIITHRDVTMTRVDHILGVTNKAGVTSVVNLNINKVLEYFNQNNQPAIENTTSNV